MSKSSNTEDVIIHLPEDVSTPSFASKVAGFGKKGLAFAKNNKYALIAVTGLVGVVAYAAYLPDPDDSTLELRACEHDQDVDYCVDHLTEDVSTKETA